MFDTAIDYGKLRRIATNYHYGAEVKGTEQPSGSAVFCWVGPFRTAYDCSASVTLPGNSGSVAEFGQELSLF